MYALAMKLRSQVKSKGYVELKKKRNLGNKTIYVLNSEWWCRGLRDTQKASPCVLSSLQSIPCFRISQRLQAHTHYLSLPMEKRSRSASFIPTCYIYSFFQQKVAYWICIPGNSWNPFIRLSASFSSTSTSQEPTPANPSPGPSAV